MAEVLDVPARSRSVDPKVTKEAEAIEKVLKAQKPDIYVGDGVEYETRSAAQSVGNRYRNILINDRVLVSDPFELGMKIFSISGTEAGPYKVALVLRSPDETAKAKQRSEARKRPSNGDSADA